jgi:biopolymer transport protein ExbD
MEEKGFDYMNVIPLVDVIMVLLVIVLMTSSFIAGGMIPVDLPKASAGKSELLKTETIVIDRRGEIFFGTAPMSIRGLGERIEGIDRMTPMLVRADRYAMVQSCVDVLDLLSVKGFRKVALQTERGGT